MRVAVLRFPGSNADWDALFALRHRLQMSADYVFHKESSLSGFDAAIVPGGFSFGDYLRPGAIAAFSPIVPALRAFAEAGAPILGICNGFQVLTELGLVPGALTRNKGLRFVCRDVHVRVASTRGFWTRHLPEGRVLRLPIAHADGRYMVGAMSSQPEAALHYCDREGNRLESANPNGSAWGIAGVHNPRGNVLGLMPHPERASDALTGNDDGLQLLEALCHP